MTLVIQIIQMIKTIKGKLVAKKDGIYTIYVFELENNEYVMCTQLPNWDVPTLTKGEIGFVTYEDAVAGEKYFNPRTGMFDIYNYTNTYFKNFIKDEEKINKEIIIV